jgi:hypothetical protein
MHLQVTAQELGKPMTADEAKEWSVKVENPFAKLSVKDRDNARDDARATLAYVVKCVLHRSDPAKYPLEAAASSPEYVVNTAIKDVSSKTFAIMRDKINLMMANPTRRSAILGKFKDIDFQKKTIAPDIKNIIKKDTKPYTFRDKDEASVDNTPPSGLTTGLGGNANTLDALPAFNKMDLVLRAVHCVDETDPESGDDDIVVGGIIIGCSGNVVKARSLVSCHFDDNEYCNHGAFPFGTYNLGSCSGYPKVFYAIIQLIEADSDEADVAQALSDVMGIVAVALAGTGYGAIFAAVAAAIEVFSDLFFDDDAFHPYGVTLNLPSQTHFGSDGRSSNWATGNITDHGGTYRLGFYWQLKN